VVDPPRANRIPVENSEKFGPKIRRFLNTCSARKNRLDQDAGRTRAGVDQPDPTEPIGAKIDGAKLAM
jgi:hypothetical protein